MSTLLFDSCGQTNHQISFKRPNNRDTKINNSLVFCAAYFSSTLYHGPNNGPFIKLLYYVIRLMGLIDSSSCSCASFHVQRNFKIIPYLHITQIITCVFVVCSSIIGIREEMM